MTNERLDYNHKNLIDLRIKQAKREFELNFSILSFENFERMQLLNKKHTNSAFVQAYFIVKNNNELFKFLEKANSDNIYTLSYDSNNKNITNFLKKIDFLVKLSDNDILSVRNKIKKDIRKLEGAISEIEDMMLESLPINNYRS